MKFIAPSLLSADVWQLSKQLPALEEAGCAWLHLDVMDGHFVPNICHGPAEIQSLRSHCKMIFDVHLMVEEPTFLLPSIAKAGADYCTVHVEACRHLDRMLRQIRSLDMKPGVSLNPATPLCAIEEVLDLVDLVLLMGVNPGFGGQSLIENTLSKIERVAAMRESYGQNFLIEIDGGVSRINAARIAKAGADVLVAGNAIFAAPDYLAAFEGIKKDVNLSAGLPVKGDR